MNSIREKVHTHTHTRIFPYKNMDGFIFLSTHENQEKVI